MYENKYLLIYFAYFAYSGLYNYLHDKEWKIWLSLVPVRFISWIIDLRLKKREKKKEKKKKNRINLTEPQDEVS